MNNDNTQVNLITKFESTFFKRTVVITLIITGLVFLYALCFNWRWAINYAVISLLTTLNFYFLYLILKRLLLESAKAMAIILLCIKFFLFAAIGFFFILWFGFNITAFLAGFNTLFIVIILRVMGIYFFALQARQYKNK